MMNVDVPLEVHVQQQILTRDPLCHGISQPSQRAFQHGRLGRPGHPRAQLRQRFVHGLDNVLRVFHAWRANGQASVSKESGKSSSHGFIGLMRLNVDC